MDADQTSRRATVSLSGQRSGALVLRHAFLSRERTGVIPACPHQAAWQVSGQRRCGKPHPVVFAQVREHMEVQAGTV
jgi:hypothetical protein